MTLKAEMSQITRSFEVSRAKRSREINEMKKLLARQVKEGRSTAHLMSSQLNESIQLDLRNIYQYVFANRNAVSSLILSYKAGRQVSKKALRVKLEFDRARLTATVKKILLGFEQDRITTRESIRGNAVTRKSRVKQSVVTSAPASPAVKASSPTPASPAVKASSPTPAAPSVKASMPTPAAPSVKASMPTPAAPAVKASRPTPAAPPVKASSPTPAAPAVKASSPTPAAPAVKASSPTLAAPAVKSNSPTPAAFPFKTGSPKK